MLVFGLRLDLGPLRPMTLVSVPGSLTPMLGSIETELETLVPVLRSYGQVHRG